MLNKRRAKNIEGTPQIVNTAAITATVTPVEGTTNLGKLATVSGQGVNIIRGKESKGRWKLKCSIPLERIIAYSDKTLIIWTLCSCETLLFYLISIILKIMCAYIKRLRTKFYYIYLYIYKYI